MKHKPLITSRGQLNWLSHPTPGHLVQFYQSSSDLLIQLTEFMSTGLSANDTCLVIATPAHIQALNKDLEKAGHNVTAVQQLRHYITFDAQEMLDRFMVNGMPDQDLFNTVIGTIVESFAQQGKPVRAYGEMVAQLWKVGNKNAVIALENLWNTLMDRVSFSLFCAYPWLHFAMDHDMPEKIQQCHNVSLSV